MSDLLLSILAMDAYNQDYAPGVKHGSTQIGTARFQEESNPRAGSEAVEAGLYGVAGLSTVISHRGTASVYALPKRQRLRSFDAAIGSQPTRSRHPSPASTPARATYSQPNAPS